MSAEDNKRAAMATWKAFASRDPVEIAAMFTEDAEWFAPPGNATAAALNATKHVMGKADIVQFIAFEFGKLFARDVKLDFKGLYGDGDIVVVEHRLQRRWRTARPTTTIIASCSKWRTAGSGACVNIWTPPKAIG
jgi:hypothetical protein